MKIILFEDEGFDRLYPLTYLRPVYELRCGALSLREKVQMKFPGCRLYLETRDVLDAVAKETCGADAVNAGECLAADDDLLLINAGAILKGRAHSYAAEQKVAATPEGEVVWAYLNRNFVAGQSAASARELAVLAADELGTQACDDLLMRYPWDLVGQNAAEIEADFAACYGAAMEGHLDERAAIWGDRSNLHLGRGAEVEPCAFIDCREGPVVIAEGAVVHAHSSIHGPAFIGPKTHLFEARIREGTSLGPVCRVGGEVEESIIHGHSNKYHTGFLGHSYVGEWVNLGALTTNSDLKNDYGSVTVYLNGKPMDTGSMKVGSFIGDHTKTSIGTLLNTGSVVGIMCNLLGGSRILPKYVPSFCWFLEGRISKGLGLATALETARAAMGRRGVELTDAAVRLIEYTEELTRAEKMVIVKRERRKAFR